MAVLGLSCSTSNFLSLLLHLGSLVGHVGSSSPTRIDPSPIVLGAWSLSHWTTRDITHLAKFLRALILCSIHRSESGEYVHSRGVSLSRNQSVSSAQSCPALCDPMNRSTPGLRHPGMWSQVGLSISTNKASGCDGIPVELFQILKDDPVKVLHSICQQIWKTQQWPQDWKRSVFIPIPKKGNTEECSNYRIIALSNAQNSPSQASAIR